MKLILRPQDKHIIYTENFDPSSAHILCERDDVEFGDIVSIGDKKYKIASALLKQNVGFLKPININMDEKELYYEPYIKCPVCGCENHDSWEAKDESKDYECGECGSILSYTSEVTRTFDIEVVTPCEIKSAIPSTVGNNAQQ